MIIWRGWGILVLVAPILLWLVLAGIALGVIAHPLDPQSAAAFVYRSFAIAAAISALALWPIALHRHRAHPGVDHLAFIPMRYWPPVLLVLALAAVGASFVPVALRAFTG